MKEITVWVITAVVSNNYREYLEEFITVVGHEPDTAFLDAIKTRHGGVDINVTKYTISQEEPVTKLKYCIEVMRESRDDDYVIHASFDKEPTEQEIIEAIEDEGYSYDPDYNKLTYYQV